MARTRRPVDRPMLIASFGLAVGLFLIILAGISATTGRDALRLPDAIELVYPKDGDTVLRQESIMVDLIPGYTGELQIDGLLLPTEEVKFSGQPTPETKVDPVYGVKFDLGSNKLTYQPQKGAPIEQFTVGTHELLVIFWRIDQGRDNAISYRSTFKVSL